MTATAPLNALNSPGTPPTMAAHRYWPSSRLHASR